MGIASAVAKGAAKKGVKSAAKKAAKKAPKVVKPKRVTPKPKMTPAGTNAVGMRFDMGAGASVGTAAPAASSYVPGKVGRNKNPLIRPLSAQVTRYQPLASSRSVSSKTVRKMGAGAGATAITGGIAMTADQKQRQLNRVARGR